MVFGCAANTVKCLVIFFNFLAFAAGAAILAGCIAAYVSNPVQDYLDQNFIDKVTNYNNFKVALIVGMVIGAIIMLLGFLGCCGAFMENQCMIGLFIVLLTILLLIQIAVGCLVLVFKDKVKDGINKALDDMDNSATDPNNSLHQQACQAYHDLSQAGICCGNGGDSIIAYQNDCVSPDVSCTSDSKGKNCKDEVWNALQKIAVAAGIVLLVFMILEVGAIVFGFCLCCTIKNGRSIYQ